MKLLEKISATTQPPKAERMVVFTSGTIFCHVSHLDLPRHLPRGRQSNRRLEPAGECDRAGVKLNRQGCVAEQSCRKKHI
ncbi:MAG TPA: hypothetical protein DCQ92_12735 [Verrucomicrobia subdivision 3 bacterium]|nr:hypothetical protein [Limisphaerales bacterium]